MIAFTYLCYGPHKWASRLVVTRDQNSMGCIARWDQADQTIGQEVSESHSWSHYQTQNMGM